MGGEHLKIFHKGEQGYCGTCTGFCPAKLRLTEEFIGEDDVDVSGRCSFSSPKVIGDKKDPCKGLWLWIPGVQSRLDVSSHNPCLVPDKKIRGKWKYDPISAMPTKSLGSDSI